MSWLDRLKELPAEVIGTTARIIPDPVEDYLLKPVARPFSQAMNWSEEHGKEWSGDLWYWMARLSPGNSLDYLPQSGRNTTEEEILRAREQGFGGRTGGRAVWEMLQSENNLITRGALDVINPFDPINAVGYAAGVGPVRGAIGGARAGAGLRGLPELGMAMRTAEGAGLGQRLVGRAVEGASKGLWYGGIRSQEIPGELAFRGAGKALGKTAGRYIKPSNRTAYNREMRGLFNAMSERVAARNGQMTPFPKLAQDPDFSPWRRSPWQSDTVRGALLESAGSDAYQRLRLKFPGIKRHDELDAIDGVATMRPSFKEILTSPNLGITPGQDIFARNSVPALTSDDIDDLALVLSNILDTEFENVVGGPDAALKWAGQSMEAARQGAYSAFGPGIQPYIPVAMSRLAENHPLPDPVYWLEGGVEQGGAAIQRGLRGSASQPGMREKAATVVASEIIPNRIGGDSAAAFSMPDPSDTVQRGQLYDAALVAKGAKGGVPTEFERLMTEAVQGPDNLMWGSRLPDGTFVPAKQLARNALEREFGLPMSDPEFEEVWKLGVRYTYEAYLKAAQEVDVTLTSAAKRYLKGEGREAINQSVMDGAKDVRKMGVTSSGLSSGDAVDKTSIAYKFERDPEYVKRPESYSRNPFGGPHFGTKENILDESGNVLSRSPVGILMPNLAAMMDAISRGYDIDVFGTAAGDWYDAAAREIVDLFGPDRMDDAVFFMDLVAATSQANGPAKNLEYALQAFVNYKAGDTGYLKALGLTDEQIAEFADRVAQQGRLIDSFHNSTVMKSVERYEKPGIAGDKGGQKQTSYGGSFDVMAQREALSRKLAGNPELQAETLDAYDRAIAYFTADRHEMRTLGHGIKPTKIDYAIAQRMGREASRKLGILPPRGQAAKWYWSKGIQGFTTLVNDSIAESISKAARRMGVSDLPPGEKLDAIVRQTIERFLSGEGGVGPGKFGRDRRGAIIAMIKDDILPRLQNDKSYWGETFSTFDPGKTGSHGLRPADDIPPEGYMVALTGTPLLRVDDPQALRKIENVLTTFKNTLQGDYGDEVKIGIFKDFDDEGNTIFSFDLSAYVADLEDAKTLGRILNQKSIWDIKAGEGIEIPHPPTNKEVGTSPIETARQADKVLEALTFDTVQDWARGVEKNGLGIVSGPMIPEKLNPFSYLDNTVAKIAEKMVPIQREIAESYRTSGVDDIANMGKVTDPMISDEANKVLFDRRFKSGTKFSGKTYGEVHDALRVEYQAGLDQLKAQGIELDPDLDISDQLKLITGDEAKKVVKAFDKLGLDPFSTTADNAALKTMEREIRKQFGIDAKNDLSKYEMLRAAWGEQALFSPRYHTANLVGNWMQNVIGGGNLGVPVKQIWRGVRSAGRGSASRMDSDGAAIMKATETARGWGLIEAPAEITRTHAVHGTVEKVNGSPSEIAKFARKVFGDKFGKVLGKPFEASQILAQGMEMGFRGAAWNDIFEHGMYAEANRIQGIIEDAAAKSGVTNISDRINLVTKKGLVGQDGGILSVANMKQTLVDAGIKEGYAENIVRTFVNARRTQMDKAVDEVNRRFFSYDRTNVDEFIAKFVPFHYWASRATRFYVEEGLRHPIWLVNYARLTEGIDRLAEEPGLSARSKGFINLLNSPTGFTLMMNPESLLGVAKMFQLDSTYTPDGETELGKIIRMGKERGIGLLPWVDAMFNYMGAYGDTFEPDPAGIRIKALVGAGIQYITAQTGQEPPQAPYASANAHLRSWISSFAGSWLPDWAAQPVAIKASSDGTLATATLDDIIASRIMAENPNLTNGELLEILSDPGTEEYQSAYRDAATAGLLQNVLNFTIPTTSKIRENSRDVDRAKLNTIRKYAAEKGVEPYEYVPTIGDASFAAEYERQTGKKWNPGDYDQAQFKRDIAVAPVESRAYVIQEHEYHALGSPHMQQLNERAQDIRAGRWAPPGFPTVMSQDERNMLADAWIAKNDTHNELQQLKGLQQSYRQTHPEFDEFKNWQAQMYNIESAYGNLAIYRQQVMQHNPNARKYFEGVIERIKNDMRGQPADKMIAELDRATLSPSAWFAVTGRSASNYDPAPLPTGNLPYDPATQFTYDQTFQNMQQGQINQPYQPAPSTWLQALAARQ